MLARPPKHHFACRPTTFTSRDLARKEALRAHVDQLSPDQQRRFVLAALLLMNGRLGPSAGNSSQTISR